jgi:hypothetical protein
VTACNNGITFGSGVFCAVRAEDIYIVERCAGIKCKYIVHRRRQTLPLVRDGAPHQQIRKCLTEITIWSSVTNGCLKPRRTGRLTVGRNITLTLTLSEDVSPGAEGRPLLEDVAKQRSEDRD